MTAWLAASILGIRTNTPFRGWAAMKDQDDTVPKLERASAKTRREYEAFTPGIGRPRETSDWRGVTGWHGLLLGSRTFDAAPQFMRLRRMD